MKKTSQILFSLLLLHNGNTLIATDTLSEEGKSSDKKRTEMPKAWARFGETFSKNTLILLTREENQYLRRAAKVERLKELSKTIPDYELRGLIVELEIKVDDLYQRKMYSIAATEE
jgi:hypothetical protein